jgi:hypothetical protein
VQWFTLSSNVPLLSFLSFHSVCLLVEIIVLLNIFDLLNFILVEWSFYHLYFWMQTLENWCRDEWPMKYIFYSIISNSNKRPLKLSYSFPEHKNYFFSKKLLQSIWGICYHSPNVSGQQPANHSLIMHNARLPVICFCNSEVCRKFIDFLLQHTVSIVMIIIIQPWLIKLVSLINKWLIDFASYDQCLCYFPSFQHFRLC